MKRWTGLLLVLGAAAVVALTIAARMRPSELERRHAKIRLGMTVDEVAEIMVSGRQDDPGNTTFDPPDGWIWSWRSNKSFLVREVEVAVTFDDLGRVIRTRIPPRWKQGSPRFPLCTIANGAGSRDCGGWSRCGARSLCCGADTGRTRRRTAQPSSVSECGRSPPLLAAET